MTTAELPTRTPARLKTRYRDEIRPALKTDLGIAIVMDIPGVQKSSSTWVSATPARDSKLMTVPSATLSLITGQKPTVRKATKSIAQFKLREGQAIGAKVTRGATDVGVPGPAVFDCAPAYPRLPRPFAKQFGRRGNTPSVSLKQSIFHEIDQDRN